MNHQNLRNTNPEEGKRFFVPENHIYHDSLVALFDSPTFQFIKAGFDQFKIPFYFEGCKLWLGDHDDVQHEVLFDELSAKEDSSFFVHSNLTPIFHKLLGRKIKESAPATIKEVSEAYLRLQKATSEYSPQETSLDVPEGVQKIWESFSDLLVIATHLWCFKRLGCGVDRHQVDNHNALAFLLYFDWKNEGDPAEANHTEGDQAGKAQGESSQAANCQTMNNQLAEYESLPSGPEEATFSIKLGFQEIFDVFDQLKGLLFWHAKLEYLDESADKITAQIVADYYDLAKNRCCYLSFDHQRPIVTLLTYGYTEVTYRIYSAWPGALNNLLILVDDIKSALKKDELSDQSSVYSLIESAKVAMNQIVISKKPNYPH